MFSELSAHRRYARVIATRRCQDRDVADEHDSRTNDDVGDRDDRKDAGALQVRRAFTEEPPLTNS